MAGRKGRSGRRPGDKEMGRLAAARSRLQAAIGDDADRFDVAFTLIVETYRQWLRARKALGTSTGVEDDGRGLRIAPLARRERALARDLLAGLREFGLTPRSATKRLAAKKIEPEIEAPMPWDEIPPFGDPLE